MKISRNSLPMVRTGLVSAIGARWLLDKLHEVTEMVKKHEKEVDNECNLWSGIVVYIRRNKEGLYMELRILMEDRPTLAVKLLIRVEDNCKGWKGWPEVYLTS